MKNNNIIKLNEGLNLHYKNGYFQVEMTDLHELGVDTSLQNNPLVTDLNVKLDNGKFITVPCISMFTRRNNGPDGYEDLDGNPVLYALKKETKYKFKSDNDLEFIKNRFREIFKKHFNLIGSISPTIINPIRNYVQLPNSIITVPSKSNVNELMCELIKKEYPIMKIIDHALCKLSTTDVFNICTNFNSEFYKYYTFRKGYNEYQLDKVYNELDNYLEKMDIQCGCFKKHYIKNQRMRTLIQNTLQLTKDYKDYEKAINHKDIILLDDTITYGQTLKEAIQIITDAYKPNSITVLTMFSKKQNY